MWAVTVMLVAVMPVAVTVMLVAVMPVAVSVKTLLLRFVSFFINPEEVDWWVFLMVAMEQVVVAALSWRVLIVWIVGILAVKKTT